MVDPAGRQSVLGRIVCLLEAFMHCAGTVRDRADMESGVLSLTASKNETNGMGSQ